MPSRPAKASSEHPQIGLADVGVEQGRTGEPHQFGDARGTRRTRTTFAGRLPVAGGAFAWLGGRVRPRLGPRGRPPPRPRRPGWRGAATAAAARSPPGSPPSTAGVIWTPASAWRCRQISSTTPARPRTMFGSQRARLGREPRAPWSSTGRSSSARRRRRRPPARRRSWRACCPCCSRRRGSSASRPKTRQAAGMENFWWRYMISLCGDWLQRLLLGDLRLQLRRWSSRARRA